MVWIKRGDIVTLEYTEGRIRKGIEVLYVPNSVGELWYFKSPSGEVYAQNPLSCELNRIVKERDGRP